MAQILVVDDEEGIRSFVAECLETEGHQISRAESGEDALRLAEKQSFALAITDLRMPGMDGLALLAALRDQQPDIEVIVLTAHGNVDTAVQAMKAGAFDFLQKPVSSPSELRLLAARAIERRTLKAMVESSQLDKPVPQLGYGDPVMKPITRALQKVAKTDATVLLRGESGTGKEVAARAIHNLSPRASGPFVVVNCATLSENLLESELFGHERGAFTGADSRKRGRIELASGGTFFLDELGEMKVELQAKLLRVLQERVFERVGGTRSIEADVRWIAATNRDLRAMIDAGTFREDLYHRIAVFPITLPPLRERVADIDPLSDALLRQIRSELKRPALSLSEAARKHLRNAPWPGNIRELRNVLERAAILADGETIELADVAMDAVHGSAPPPPTGDTLEALERKAIAAALDTHNGSRKAAAASLGIGLRTLYDKLKRYDIG